MGDEWGKAEGQVLEPALEGDVLGLVGEEDDRCGRVGRPGKQEEGKQYADWIRHDDFCGIRDGMDSKDWLPDELVPLDLCIHSLSAKHLQVTLRDSHGQDGGQMAQHPRGTTAARKAQVL